MRRDPARTADPFADAAIAFCVAAVLAPLGYLAWHPVRATGAIPAIPAARHAHGCRHRHDRAEAATGPIARFAATNNRDAEDTKR